MKYLLAVISIPFSIVEVVVMSIIMFFINLFRQPTRRYNEIIYGKKKNNLKVLDKGEFVIIELPNGQKIKAKKSEVDNNGSV